MAIEVFNRVEKKYLLPKEKYEDFLKCVKQYMDEDKFCIGNAMYAISNIYFDTWDDELIRRSTDKPVYKEKMRLRSYGIPKMDDKVFLEIKKKYRGVVNKRRTVLRLNEAYDFLLDGKIPQKSEYVNAQVLKELIYFMEYYKPVPKVYLAYDRKALFGKEDSNLRLTFDTNIRARREDVRLEAGDWGELLVGNDNYLMEIKTTGAMPIWMAELLNDMEIHCCSFSKYGTEYRNYLKTQQEIKNKLFIYGGNNVRDNF